MWSISAFVQRIAFGRNQNALTMTLSYKSLRNNTLEVKWTTVTDNFITAIIIITITGKPKILHLKLTTFIFVAALTFKINATSSVPQRKPTKTTRLLNPPTNTRIT